MNYQDRYLAHQARKKMELIEIMKQRHSKRMFADKQVPEKVVDALLVYKDYSPSSCDRQGIVIKTITDKDNKALLGGLLVGGVGWVHRAPVIFLLFGDTKAYVAGDESTFMPYLDAGCIVQTFYLGATEMGLYCAYVNPNVREANKEHFKKTFGEGIFCGAFCFGYPYEEK